MKLEVFAPTPDNVVKFVGEFNTRDLYNIDPRVVVQLEEAGRAAGYRLAENTLRAITLVFQAINDQRLKNHPPRTDGVPEIDMDRKVSIEGLDVAVRPSHEGLELNVSVLFSNRLYGVRTLGMQNPFVRQSLIDAGWKPPA